MKIGLVGLPLVGKTTLFNLLTGNNIEVSEFSVGKVEANMGIAKIPDERIDFLTDMFKPKKITHATIEVTDVPGLVSGSSAGKGVGNQFLEAIRKVDALVHIIRVFESSNVPHAEGSINPMRDIETINMELLFSDLSIIENRIERIEKGKKVTKENLAELEVLKKCKEALEAGLLIHNMDLSDDEREHLKTFGFLSEKPMIYVANIDENQLMGKDYPQREELLAFVKERNIPLVEICAKTELEINQLEAEDKEIFMTELGITESGIDKLAKSAYDYLGLMSFLTAGQDEVRAWTIKKNTPAKKAAGKIHSDIEKGFIRAEVVRFNDLKELGTMVKVKEKGLATLEGKEYIVQNGDIINFRFNV
ncbi:redox-regulated ATPase YchF [Alkaliphilus serpentinus]|uniref:Ribosome-binding ATPase YchF n=1 Tax=Alkaliphilus serpentinus TaxID=1482731 RepID=A0A833HNS3_9FIRM|nr:redox-regulated ATPase YchF [Alkaliphilus serpentinus]KAB3530018.1 redox-regulated ATPase YchF [Alkaliphilus serpentinus]